MPWCDTDAMAAHLIEISAAVDPGAHAVLIVDQAGWHLTPKLAIPDNITVLALPPRSPELNPVENVWQFMRDNWLSNRIFNLRRHRRAVLPSLEQPHRPTMEDHVPRHAQMGAWVLINDRWYYKNILVYRATEDYTVLPTIKKKRSSRRNDWERGHEAIHEFSVAAYNLDFDVDLGAERMCSDQDPSIREQIRESDPISLDTELA